MESTTSVTASTRPSSFEDGKNRRLAAEVAAKKILRCYPDYGKAPAEYVANLMAALQQYPVEIIAKLADLKNGVVSKTEFLPTPKHVFDLGDVLLSAAMEAEKTAHYSSLKLLSMDDYDAQRKDDPSELERRKGFVIRELGYDPANGGRKTEWCFDPQKPPVNAPWHDKAELAASAKRIKAETGLVECEFSDAQGES